MFEDLPVELTQPEERMLRAIVASDSARRQTRRNSIGIVVLVAVIMLGAVWALFYVPMGDLSEYKSLADGAYSILLIGSCLWNCYFIVKSVKLKNQLIRKLFAALSPMDASKSVTDPTELLRSKTATKDTKHHE